MLDACETSSCMAFFMELGLSKMSMSTVHTRTMIYRVLSKATTCCVAALGYILIYVVAIAITMLRVMKVTVEFCFYVSITC